MDEQSGRAEQGDDQDVEIGSGFLLHSFYLDSFYLDSFCVAGWDVSAVGCILSTARL